MTTEHEKHCTHMNYPLMAQHKKIKELVHVVSSHKSTCRAGTTHRKFMESLHQELQSLYLNWPTMP